jgi:hypothetical protein
MPAKSASAIAVSVTRMADVRRPTSKATNMSIGTDRSDTTAAKSWRKPGVWAVMHPTTRISTAAASETGPAACETSCMAAGESAGVTAAESTATVSAATSESAAVGATATTAMSAATAAGVLSERRATYGQKGRQGDGPKR